MNPTSTGIPCSSGAERPIRQFITGINDLDLDLIMNGSDLYALRFNPNRSCRYEQPDATRHLAWQMG